MYPEGAHELEKELEHAFGQAVMSVAYAYLFQEVPEKVVVVVDVLSLLPRMSTFPIDAFLKNVLCRAYAYCIQVTAGRLLLWLYFHVLFILTGDEIFTSWGASKSHRCLRLLRHRRCTVKR